MHVRVLVDGIEEAPADMDETFTHKEMNDHMHNDHIHNDHMNNADTHNADMNNDHIHNDHMHDEHVLRSSAGTPRTSSFIDARYRKHHTRP